MRWFLSFLLIVGVAGTLPLAKAPAAQACSCAYVQNGPQIVEQVGRAAASFTGTPTTTRTDGGTAYYEFAVREVFAGDIGPTTVVSSSIHDASCGRSFTLGAEYLVFVSRYDTKGAPWSVESCSATTESTNTRTRDAATTVYGQPRPPDTAGHSVGIDENGMPVWQRLALTALAVVAVSTVAALILRARRSRRTGA
ncbi:hypothetical protein [Rhodococcus gannanensis]|uniref:Tissue inhibitor of metalloproteinase n=1 Tax=Rhodococcus gannanensis TaxID=1960308 RepID=A0ABW4NY37_9NOCA